MSTPHKWAKEIKAWADGAEIESRKPAFSRAWRANNFTPAWDDNEYEHRIKPERKVLRYRVAAATLDNGLTHYPIVAHHQGDARGIEGGLYFVRWVTDWIEVEL